MILPIYTYGQPVLRQVAEEIDSSYPQLDQVIADMRDTLVKSDGIGLAAPQVGLSIRLVIIDLTPLAEEMPEYKDYVHTFINPYIEEYDETETDVSEEGCLSIPGIHESVRRPTRIRVTYLDEQFQPTTSGWAVIWHVSCSMSSTIWTEWSSPTTCRGCAAS